MKSLVIKTASNTIYVVNGKVSCVRCAITGRFVAVKKFANIVNNLIIKTLQSILILVFMTIGFVFVGAFVEYKILNGANIYAGLTFAIILCTVMSATAFVVIKETVLNKGVMS